MTKESLLDVVDLTVDFPSDDGIVHAVRGVTYSIAGGEVLAIVGESGSGKSVSCLALMGLLPKTAKIGGSAKYRGQELLGMKPKALNKIRGVEVAMIFQDPMTSLNPVYTVGWQLAEAVRAHNPGTSKRDALSRAVDLLELVSIPNAKDRASGYPHEYSGGMRQRAVIAMAMANDPDVIIADEPTTALDVTVQAQVLETLQKAQEETQAAMVLITHDLGVVAGVADKVLVMYAGTPVETGSVDDIFYRPRMPYALGLLGSLPRLDLDESTLTPITGAPPSLINLPAGCPFSPRCPLVAEICLEVEPELMATTSGSHLAACHRWRELEGDVTAADVFAVTASDTVVLAPSVGTEGSLRAGPLATATAPLPPNGHGAVGDDKVEEIQ